MRVFISYRRADTKTIVGRLYDRLTQAFSADNIFMDVDSIPLGLDFRRVIRESLEKSDVILFVIGDQWLNIKDREGKRRLDDIEDAVRIEVETALQLQDKLILPILVDNASMPISEQLPLSMRELSYKNAVPLRDERDFHRDVLRLIERIQQHENTVIHSPDEIHAAIDKLYQYIADKKWEIARRQLEIIKNSKALPRFLDVSRLESSLDAGESEQKNSSQAQSEYNVLRVMTKYESPEKVREALSIFWESYPNYDPDDLVTQFDLVGYNLYIDDIGVKKINIIKVVRQLTNLGLKEAKDLVESPPPILVLSGVNNVIAHDAKALIEVEGAKVRLAKTIVPDSNSQITDEPIGFNVYIQDIGSRKIDLIKVVRQLTNLGLKEAKDLVESPPPILVFEQVDDTNAKLAKSALEAAGAVVHIG